MGLTSTQHSSSDSGHATGAGVYADGSSVVTMKNTIVANNSILKPSSDENYFTGEYPDYSGPYTSEGYNLIKDTSGASGSGDTSTDITGEDPSLGSLAGNGGWTQTMALQSGSPAINAVREGCPPPSTDQRDVSRPQGTYCDIGAFERQGTGTDTQGTQSASSGTRAGASREIGAVRSGASDAVERSQQDTGSQANEQSNAQGRGSGADLSFAVGTVLPTIAGLFTIGALGFVGFILYRHR